MSAQSDRPTMQWTPPAWFLWLMRLLGHPSMKKKVKRPDHLTVNQRFLFNCIGRALEHANSRRKIDHADHLRVLETFRGLITEDFMERHPELVPELSKLLGKS